MFDGERFGETEHDAALDLGAGSLVFAASEDDIVIVEPDVEEFGTALTAAAAEEVQSHDLIEELKGFSKVGEWNR
jgi:hypothetical protein